MLDYRLKWEGHVDKIKRKSTNLTRMCRAAGTAPRWAIELYRTIVRPGLEFGSQFLVHLSETNKKKIFKCPHSLTEKTSKYPNQNLYHPPPHGTKLEPPLMRQKEVANKLFNNCWENIYTQDMPENIMQEQVIDMRKHSPAN